MGSSQGDDAIREEGGSAVSAGDSQRLSGSSQLQSAKGSIQAMGLLINRIPGAFFIYEADQDEKFTLVNQAAIDLLGCSSLDDFMEYTKGSFKGFVHPDDVDYVVQSINDQIGDAQEGLDFIEYRILRKDGEVRYVADYGQLAPGEDGNCYYVYLFDRTEEKAREDAQREENARQKLLADFIKRHADLAALFDLETGTFTVIAAPGEYHGPSTGDIESIVRGGVDRILPECREEYLRTMSLEGIKACVAHQDRYYFQTFIQNEDGSIARKQNIFSALDGSKRYVLAVREDTTEAYLKEQAVIEARESIAAQQASSSEFINAMIHSQCRRHAVMVVEDSEINRDILEGILSQEYDVVSAENGLAAMSVLQGRDDIDLILLDLYMPVCDGFSFLEQVKADPVLASIPVVVATGSAHREDEERCLRLGAVDFVTKPYRPDNLMGRIASAIRVSESALTLTSFETDGKTGLYTFQAFVFHAQKLLANTDESYNLGLTDIRDFAMINSVHGARSGDEVLRFVANELVEFLPGALICRAGGRFFTLTPQSQPLRSEEIIKHIIKVRDESPAPNVRLRVGLCMNIDQSAPVALWCDRARLAVQSMGDDYGHRVVYYDESVELRKVHDMKMLADFDKAIEERQFVPWIQPKVNSATGQVEAGEALVRWFDGEGNFVSPGAFIPLFERDGCIKDLDEYIFREVCLHQKERQEAGRKIVPVSVNLSRNSLFSGGVVQRYQRIAEEIGIAPRWVPLEITESAATSDRLILDICKDFVQTGFILHMDDFGAGYSSLSSLSNLPFSVLKLDKSLIDKIGTPKGEIIIKNAVETAQDLGMEVVSEGVEEQGQIDYLAGLDCGLIQGYFYAAPMRIAAFDDLLDQDYPFADNLAHEDGGDSVVSLCAVDFKRYLKLARSIHGAVRVLDYEQCQLCMVADSGALEIYDGKCFDAWGRSSHCDNCTSRLAMESKSTQNKIEHFNGEDYLVFSKYVEVAGKPRVIELIDKLK